MKIPYQMYQFSLRFEHETRVEKFPPFFIRSVVGKELRRVACLFPNRDCTDCSLRDRCPYSFLFETPVEKNNPVLRGRNYAPHPFILSMLPMQQRRSRVLQLNLNLIGKGQEYFPYFYYAIRQAGEEGLFFQRMPYRIENVQANGQSVLKDENTIVNVAHHHVWELNTDFLSRTYHEMVVEFATPLRYKRQGKYRSSITYTQLLEAIYYRTRILAYFFGTLDETLPEKLPDPGTEKEERHNLYWRDFTRYSARQRRVLKMGGMMGMLHIKGEFTPLELSLLRAGELFHVGKNAGFGLGKIIINPIANP